MYTEYQQSHENFISDTLSDKYLRGEEKTYADIKKRIISALPPESKAFLEMEGAISCNRFLPAGSILASFGIKESKDSLSNCYYIPLQRDSIEEIFDTNKRLARTFSKRGGCGTSITVLRPKGTKVDNAAKTSTGAVSFVPLFAETCNRIGQEGRRAALLIDISIRHPDALDFIKMKASPEEVFEKDIFTGELPSLSTVNVSLNVTDAFMQAVKDDTDWKFEFPDIEEDKELYNKYWDGNYENWAKHGGKLKTYKTMKAKEVMDLWALCAWKCGDPGGMFLNNAQTAPAAEVHESLVPIGCNP